MDKKMSFWDHVAELRKRLRIPFIVFIAILFVAYPITPYIIQFLRDYFIGGYGLQLLANTPMQGFIIRIKLSMIIGLSAMIPVLVYELFAFIVPALKKKHKRWVIKNLFAASILFIAGVLFVFLILLPMIMNFFIEYNQSLGLTNLFQVNLFYQFIILNLFIGGLIFETPLLLITANRLGIIKKETLSRKRGYVYVGILLIAGILTPDHTIISQLALGIVLFALFEISLFFFK
ncbi:twin-arginine translocase subunit TatC [Candidatus Woesearchaeota archaeon]|nr:twin-arginine translocase subunit TatC [Candidatus Woesearchaeota archaeon]